MNPFGRPRTPNFSEGAAFPDYDQAQADAFFAAQPAVFTQGHAQMITEIHEMLRDILLNQMLDSAKKFDTV